MGFLENLIKGIGNTIVEEADKARELYPHFVNKSDKELIDTFKRTHNQSEQICIRKILKDRGYNV